MCTHAAKSIPSSNVLYKLFRLVANCVTPNKINGPESLIKTIFDVCFSNALPPPPKKIELIWLT